MKCAQISSLLREVGGWESGVPAPVAGRWGGKAGIRTFPGIFCSI